MNALEWQAASTVTAAKRLAHFVTTTPDDKLEWQPKSELGCCGRTAMDQIGECIRVNYRFASVLRGEGPKQVEPNLSTPAAACAQLVESAREVAAVIGTQDESILEKKFDVGFGEFPGAAVVSIPAWNMIYHCGQVNYIQLLYGDAEFHMPPME